MNSVSNLRVEGILIRIQEYRERDAILSLLTQQGILTVFAVRHVSG